MVLEAVMFWYVIVVDNNSSVTQYIQTVCTLSLLASFAHSVSLTHSLHPPPPLPTPVSLKHMQRGQL
jgi:hypothetical protein